MELDARKLSIPIRIDQAHRRCFVGNEPMLFHCHHFNMYLQQSIRDATYIDSEPFLIGAAAEVAYSQLRHIFAHNEIRDVPARKAMAEQIYRWAGFGTISLETLFESGGSSATLHSHYAMGWQARNDRPAERPICYFTTGWLAGALAAIFDSPPDAYQVRETRCAVAGNDGICVFDASRGEANYAVFESVGAGHLRTHTLRDVTETGVDYEGIYHAVTQMNLAGNGQGLIPAFGVYLTRHYGNYYNRVSFEFTRAITANFGAEPEDIAASLLIEAGRVCAFHTFGGVMQSSEWNALIRPQLKTREDWVHGMVAVLNAFGWGRWEVRELSAEGALFVVQDDYESAGYLAMYGKSARPVSHLVHGAAVGLMNLVYLADIESQPVLNAALYEKIFKQDRVYEAEAVSSIAMGDPVTSYRVVMAP